MTANSERVLLGRIAGAHGIRGDVIVHSFTGDPADIAAYGALQTGDGARQLELKVVRVTPRGVIARVAGVTDRNAAEALRGTELFILRKRLPTAAEGEYYYADLVGLRAENEAGEAVGTIAAVLNFGAGDLLEVQLHGGQATELIPFTDAFVPTVDVPGRRVVVVMPAAAEDAEDDEGTEGESL